jgi:hypothetical protein
VRGWSRGTSVAALLTLTLTETPAMATEEPHYQTLEKPGDFELRLYAPMIVAEACVEGSLN